MKIAAVTKKIHLLFIALAMLLAAAGTLTFMSVMANDGPAQFLISEYGDSHTTSVTSQRWRGYVFQLKEDTIITGLVGGGATGGFIVGIYAINSGTFNDGTGAVHPTRLMANTAATSSGGKNIELPLVGGNDIYDDEGTNKLLLEKDTYYLLASGRTTAGNINTDNQWTASGINVSSLMGDTPLITQWFPNAEGVYSYRWENVGNQSFIVDKDHADTTGNTYPLLGFLYEATVPLAEVTTQPPTLNSAEKTVTMHGSLNNIDAGETTGYIRYGLEETVTSGTTSLGVGTFTEESDNHPFSLSLSLDLDEFLLGTTYYYRARANNLAGFSDAENVQSFTVYSLEYEAGEGGSIDGDEYQLALGGQSGSTVTAVPDAGWQFDGWSDEVADAERTDSNVTQNLQLTANFSEQEPGPDNDLNGDGLVDALQNNVTAITSAVTDKVVALEVDEDCEINQMYVQAEPSHAVQDSGFDYPQGLVNFTIDCGNVDGGFTTTVKQYYYGITANDLVLRKYNSNTDAYFNIDDAEIDTEDIYGQPVVVVTYEIADNGALDLNDTLGVIADPAGLASAVVGAPNAGLGGRYR